MVMIVEWYRTTVDQKSSGGLPMTGEDTGLGSLAPPLAGYLGKIQERAASLEHCPWCTSKGLTYALHSYRINLQESITLCTNPQCLFPLVSHSLEDVFASLVPVEPTVGNKRKTLLPLEKEELIKPPPKRPRSSEPDSFGTPNVTDTLYCQAQRCAVNTVSNGQHAAPEADGEKLNGYNRVFDCPAAETPVGASLQVEDVVLEMETDSAACTEGFTPPTYSASAGHLQSSSEALLTAGGDRCAALVMSEAEDDSRQVKSHPEVLNRQSSLVSNQSNFTNVGIFSTEINGPSLQLNEQTAGTKQKSLTAAVIKDIADIQLEIKDFSPTSLTDSEEFVSVPNQLFWRNRDKLCWLDSLLAALINCRSLRKCKPRDEPQRSSVWQLMREYGDVCAAVQVHQTNSDGVMRVPSHVLQTASKDLHSLRMSVFNLLQPKLHCKLGQRETPVFAMPLLLALDSWAEPLFQSTFRWEFKCSECRATFSERVMKTLPTFTNIEPDWSPLHAVHLAPCNVCCRKNQKRTMILENVSPVFMLHFVEGLPDSDIRMYTFTFKGRRYSVTTVIQYDQRLKHFVTWMSRSDGSWLEYDDLKHPGCKTHQKLPVPAQEMHIVFWEVEEDKEPRLCSPSSTFTDSPPSRAEKSPTLNIAADEVLVCSPDQSLLTHHDTDIISVLSSNIMDTTIPADTSIGSTTLLETFEGLSHNDIITLTLVELKTDSEMTPAHDDKQTQDLNDPCKNQTLDASPDSSSAVIGGEMCHPPDADPPCISDTESGDGSLNDPTYVPGARKGRGRGTGRGKAVGRQKDKKATPPVSQPVMSEPSKVTSDKPEAAAAQEKTPPTKTAVPTPPSLSTGTSQNYPTMQPALVQHARWSFLLSKNPLNPVTKSNAKFTPTFTPTSATQVKPTPISRSIPKPVKRQQQTPGGILPKPQLRTEESDSLPPKAAEMYGGFGTKSSNAPSPLASPAPLSGQTMPFSPITSLCQKPLMNTTLVPSAFVPTPKKNGHPKSSKVPPDLSDTDALRYKLQKKLKAKKKKLAKLNQMLGHPQGAILPPHSTDLSSPNTVSSSTYDGSTCSDFLSDLLSPATTASNLSPDSTDFLEMLAKGQGGVNQLDYGVNAGGAVSQASAFMNGADTENFMDEFLSQAVAQEPTGLESEDLSALDLFM
nr:PREDICTED: SUMO-specific isopeptidase USPL1 isoform X1 [Paralichthys olivaceus]